MEYQIILTAIIALIAVLTGLGFLSNVLLGPLKVNQARLEAKMDQLLTQNKSKL